MAEDTGLSEGAGPGGGDGNGGGGSVLSSLKSKELLVPAVLSAAGAVAAAKGPDLIRRLGSSTQEKGEDEAERLGEKSAEGAKQALSKGGGGGAFGAAGKAVAKAVGGGSARKKTRRLPIQRWTDVAVPVDRAYELWTQFDEFPKFMHRVLNVERKGSDRVHWREKIWFSTREWEGEITDRRKNDRIAWKTTTGLQHSGVVSFHRISDHLTRVMVTMEFEPTGMMEKMASGLRFVKRAVQADLARFKAYAEMEDAKGLEYRGGTSQKQHEQQQRSRSERGRSNGDDRDREQEREQREQQRRERRETVAH